MTARRDYRSPEAAAYRVLYKTGRWRALRADQLLREPLCLRCTKRGLTVVATVANHVTPHKGDETLFFDPTNLESTCKPCHDGTIQQQERTGYSSEVCVDGMPLDPNHPFNR